jgi:hypothetical protein
MRSSHADLSLDFAGVALLGVERVWHFAELEQEPLLCVKRDRDRLPDYTLLYRDLARSTPRAR